MAPDDHTLDELVTLLRAEASGAPAAAATLDPILQAGRRRLSRRRWVTATTSGTALALLIVSAGLAIGHESEPLPTPAIDPPSTPRPSPSERPTAAPRKSIDLPPGAPLDVLLVSGRVIRYSSIGHAFGEPASTVSAASAVTTVDSTRFIAASPGDSCADAGKLQLIDYNTDSAITLVPEQARQPAVGGSRVAYIYVYCGDGATEVRVMDWRSGEQVLRLTGREPSRLATVNVSLSPDGSRLAVVNETAVELQPATGGSVTSVPSQAGCFWTAGSLVTDDQLVLAETCPGSRQSRVISVSVSTRAQTLLGALPRAAKSLDARQTSAGLFAVVTLPRDGDREGPVALVAGGRTYYTDGDRVVSELSDGLRGERVTFRRDPADAAGALGGGLPPGAPDTFAALVGHRPALLDASTGVLRRFLPAVVAHGGNVTSVAVEPGGAVLAVENDGDCTQRLVRFPASGGREVLRSPSRRTLFGGIFTSRWGRAWLQRGCFPTTAYTLYRQAYGGRIHATTLASDPVGVALDDHGVALYVSNSEDSTVILALDAMKGVDGQPLPIPAGCEWIPSGPVAWQASMAVAAGRCSETRYGLMSWRGAQPVFDRFGEVEVIERLATDPTGQNLLASYSGGDSYGPIVLLRHDSQSLAYRHTLVANDTACSSLDPARHCVTSADW